MPSAKPSPLGRRAFLMGAPLALAACGGHKEAPVYAPPDYTYLTPIRLNAASLDIDQRYVPQRGQSNDVSMQAPTPPAEALRHMASDRIQTLGTSGRAVFIITDASIIRARDAYTGSFAVRLEIYDNTGARRGFAEARVSRRRPNTGDDERRTLYDLTRQMMEDMNVEFEYQVRHSLNDFVVGASARGAPSTEPGAIQKQDLSAPTPSGAPKTTLAPTLTPTLTPPAR